MECTGYAIYLNKWLMNNMLQQAKPKVEGGWTLGIPGSCFNINGLVQDRCNSSALTSFLH